MDNFSIQNGPFALNKHFIRPRVTKICLFSDPKWAICPNENFSKKKTADKHSSYHSCLSTFQKFKSQISIY